MQMKLKAFTGAVCLALCAYAQNGNGNGNGNTEGAGANGKVIHETRTAHASNKAATTFDPTYHGGPLMLGTPVIYYIWYGSWTDSEKAILTDFASHIGGSPYFGINKTYYQGTTKTLSNTVSGAVTFGGSIADNYSVGSTNLSDSAIQSIVTTAIKNGLPASTNGVYFVLTSADVTKSGFCTSYCGWHTYGTIASMNIKYAFIGNAAQCPSACAEQTTSPNGNAGVDAMVSIIAHELEEAVTDPNLNAWYDKRGAENADKCAWTFGTTFPSNGAKANVTLGSRDYLIQQNWVNVPGGYCALQ
jgi:hypothetical protein